MQSIQRMLMGRGMDSAAAQSTAARMIDGSLRQQAMVLAFEKMFMLAGIAFLCVLPLVLLLKAPALTGEKIDVHVEM
ncbi:MAG TPA: hypothetical protein VIM68_06610 [Thermoanaerobaculia bacterium]